VLVALAFTLAVSPLAPTYTLRDLTPLPNGLTSAAYAVNNSGIVAGLSSLSDGSQHAVVWTKNGIHDIGTLGGQNSFGDGINDAGQIIGRSDLSDGISSHAFLWTSAGGMLDLGTLGGQNSVGLGINDAGQIVGTSDLSDGISSHAFLWTSAGGMQDLGSLNGDSTAFAINNAGEIVGYYAYSAHFYHAFLWTPANGMQDLASLDGGGSGAFAINNAGVIAGDGFESSVAPYSRAARWSPSLLLQYIGAGLASHASAINDSGRIVGSAQFGAFVWTAATHTQNLNDLIPPNTGFFLYNAFAINRSGQIVAYGTANNGGFSHGALLTPVNQRRTKD
jgi:probable HAF family extracellular repeat protein